ncbi:MAG: ABATE domain-containing protein [Actinomycetota bacterium]|nr:ABATE domain-containing protein [Actinomycetota bacterium]
MRERLPELEWALRGGVACLDFANTVGWHAGEHPVEYLNRYTDLLSWCVSVGVLDGREAEALGRRAEAEPEAARAVLARSVVLREAIYRVFSAAAGGEGPSPSDLEVLNGELQEALARLRLTSGAGGGFGWGWGGEAALERPLWSVARSAAELLTSGKLRRVKVCMGEACGWLFLDESRNRSRRWCDSRDCGNRARVRRYYARRRTGDT